MSLSSGTRLGPYEILAPLGAGGMGEVYRARDSRLGREVAIKALPAAFATDPERLARFEREARLLASLNHPNIAGIHGLEENRGHRYLILELVDGQSLAERLTGGSLPLDEALEVARQVAVALEAAHESGVVHRDLKPANVMISATGTVKVLDFGLAKGPAAAPTSGLSPMSQSPTITGHMTSVGTVLGTAAYMSPEQARGKSVDRRTDIWSFGCLLYECLTGRQAFEGETVTDLIARILEGEPDLAALPASTPARIRTLLRRCFVKDARERLRDIGDARLELQEAIRGGAAEAFGAASSPSAGATPPSLTFRLLTFRRGAVMNARLTPDARTVLYSAQWDTDPTRVFMARVDNPESTPLPLPPAALLSLSRGGELALALHRRYLGSTFMATGTLATAPLVGGTPREVFEGVSDADWAPDGENFAVTRRAGARMQLEYPIGTELFAYPGWLAMPRFSPDGRHIAFVQVGGGPGHRLGVYSLASGEIRFVVVMPTWISGITWRDDDEIWFSSQGSRDGSGLHAVKLSGGERIIARLPSTWIALQDISPQGDVLMIGTGFRASISGQLPGQDGERDLSWFDASILKDLSSDGQMLLFDEVGAGGGGGSGEVFIRRLDGSGAVRLGRGLARGLSPDKKWAVAERGDDLVLYPTGAGQTRTLDLGNVHSTGLASWFPDGTRVLTHGTEEGHEGRFYVLGLDGSPPRPVTPEGIGMGMGGSLHPVSPDGRFVCAMAPGGGVQIHASDTGDLVKALSLAEDEEPLRWGADGRTLFVWRRGELPARVDRLDIETGKRSHWKDLMPADPTGVIMIRSLMITPNGEHYAYGYLRNSSEMFLVRGLA